jgi:hypothetical protein
MTVAIRVNRSLRLAIVTASESESESDLSESDFSEHYSLTTIFISVTDFVKMADLVGQVDALPLVGMHFLLNAIGFNIAEQRELIMEAGLADYEDFRHLNDKDIRDMAEEFHKRTIPNGRIIFGLGRTKKLIGIMHWIQDCYRASDVPDHNNFSEQALAEAQSRALIRKSDVELVDTNTKAADPKKFKDERKWPEWEKAFVNYLSVIPGVNGIPLSYVVREAAEPEEGVEYDTFNERMIARAPHEGQYYLADSRRVHNLLTGYLQGEQSESWIRGIAKYQDGRRDIIALRRHYAGEGNSTRRISDAKRIQTTLHYKSERALPFNKFLDTLQKMFTIFEEENEPLTERAKVDELLTKVQNSSLSAAVAQLRFQLNTEGVTFTVAANHLNSAVSQTPDYQLARKISATNSDRQQGGRGGRGGRGWRGGGGRGRGGRFGRSGGRGSSDAKGKDGGTSTNYYSPAEWSKLSFEERDKIRKERDKKGEQGGTKRSIGDMSVEQFTAIISAVKNDQSTVNTADSTDTSASGNNAGNAFGGKEAAKRTKFSS